MGKNTQRLGDVLAGRMQKTARANSPTALELGTITSDGSLKIDGLAGNISPSEYMIDLRLTHADYLTLKTEHFHSDGSHGGHSDGTGTHTHDGGIHNHRLSSVFRRPRAGDRVLVAWVGYEPIIVAIVVAGTTITN